MLVKDNLAVHDIVHGLALDVRVQDLVAVNLGLGFHFTFQYDDKTKAEIMKLLRGWLPIAQFVTRFS